jgi:predicted metal-binding membrane protein
MTDRQPTPLDRAELRLSRAFARPRLIIGIATLAALSWLYLVWASAHMAHGSMPSPRAWSAADFVGGALMWCAMTLAMMLPSAGPMILTYAEIAETAARKGERIVSPWVLTAGYTVVWLGFGGTAAVLQGVLTYAGLLDTVSHSAGTLLSAALFVAAGLYQFSPLKHACLTQCQRPYPFFLANWTTETPGIFRLGVRQGLYCLGCCWVFMLLMFAVGVMSIIGMLVLGLIIIGEKMTTRLDRPIGILLLAIGAGLVLSLGYR